MALVPPGRGVWPQCDTTGAHELPDQATLCAGISTQPDLVLCLTRNKLIIAEKMCNRDRDKTDSRPGTVTLSTSYFVILAEVTMTQVPAATRAGSLCSMLLPAEPAAAAEADLRA